INADTKSLKQIAAESKILTKSAQEGNINPDLLAGGTFTVSNLGVLGIESFTPVINPPQTGILGVNCIVERVRSQNGQITVYPSMSLSLTYDHRALDGAPASRFLMDLKNALENFPVLLAGN
ncbi:MAG: 2-oxo acid dehydrogenase subunit E2, partial [Clostridiaceae bacterium]|nr:2-oxo acid dehydrogenase subunit E2 [Clostridiaceae bacterium]